MRLIQRLFISKKSSAALITEEKKYLAQNYKPLDVVLTHGKGTRLVDSEGNSYLDFLSAYGAVNAGHSHKRIVNAMVKQLKTLDVPSRAFYNDKLGQFAKELCKMTGMDKMLPMNTGAEAVETAVKAARRWGYRVKKIKKDKAKILVSSGNFHGRTTTIVGFSSDAAYKKDFGPFDGGFEIVPYGDLQALERALKDKNVCAYITEPMQGEAGIILPPKGWLKKVQTLCKKYNVLLILDEVQSGMGRTGKDFAFQHEIKKPDGLILGKALGGGIYPVSAFLARADVMDVFEPGSHGSTFGGNPIGCAIGLEVLAVMRDEKLSQKSAKLGAYLLQKLQAIKSPIISDVRGAGLWVGVDINPKFHRARTVCEHLKKRGLLCKETHETVVRFAPPLTVRKREIDWAVKQFAAVIKDLEK